MDLARDSSLGDDSGSGPGPRRRTAITVVGAVFALLFATDQVTKALAVRHLGDGLVHPWAGRLLQLHLTRNPGAAFSTGTTYTWLLSSLAVLAVLVVVFLSRRVRSGLWAVAFGLLLAGIGGNLTDRVFRAPAPMRGHVVDFLQLPHWPIFNVADVCINVAAALVLVQVFRGVRLDGTRGEQTADVESDLGAGVPSP